MVGPSDRASCGRFERSTGSAWLGSTGRMARVSLVAGQPAFGLQPSPSCPRTPELHGLTREDDYSMTGRQRVTIPNRDPAVCWRIRQGIGHGDQDRQGLDNPPAVEKTVDRGAVWETVWNERRRPGNGPHLALPAPMPRSAAPPRVCGLPHLGPRCERRPARGRGFAPGPSVGRIAKGRERDNGYHFSRLKLVVHDVANRITPLRGLP